MRNLKESCRGEMAERSKAPESGTDISGHIVAWVRIPLSSSFYTSNSSHYVYVFEHSYDDIIWCQLFT